MNIPEDIGARLRKARERKAKRLGRKRLTLVEVADAIGYAHPSLSRIERDLYVPSKQTLIALAKYYADDFGVPELTKYIDTESDQTSKREIAGDLTVEQLITLKFGGSGETRSRADMRALARMLDEAIAKEERIMGYPEIKKKEDE